MSLIWKIEIARPAGKELSRLPSNVQNRIARAILALENDRIGQAQFRLRRSYRK
jgi:mRNA-degrading endonuclease RelE of RelBE toxin-antitoxin system